MRIAIIGAGMAGLAAGTRLAHVGHDVQLFDKGRGAGGRMASRRIASAHGDTAFDHGAQYFTVRDAAFAACVAQWQRAGLAAPWPAAGPAAFVGTPSMNSPLRAMAGPLDVRWNSRIDAIHRDASGWILRTEAVETSRHDALIVALPAEQAAVLLAPIEERLAGLAMTAVSAPCWTVMLSLGTPVRHAADILAAPAEPIGWAARNSAKPGRTGPEAWVVQASPQWSTDHLEDSAAAVIDALLRAFFAAIDETPPDVISAAAHRWRYARSTIIGLDQPWDASRQVGVCGDWLIGPRVEAAWLSGQRLADAIIG